MDQKVVDKIGWFASLMAIIMFCSYIDQIRLNLSGRPGSIILPVATIVNGVSWVLYALLKERKDWPIAVCNTIGVVLGLITALTAI